MCAFERSEKGMKFKMIVIVGIGEVLGAILGVIGLVLLLVMSASSNYTDVGIGMGIAILSLIIFLSSLVLIITRLKVSREKTIKKKRQKL